MPWLHRTPCWVAAVKSTVGTDELASAGAAHDALADLGVGFVSIAGASTEPLVNQLDATAGVTRLSNNNGLILWRVLPRGSAIGSSRVRLVDATGAPGVDPCHRRPRSNRCRHRSCHGRICSWASARGGRAEPVGSPRRRDVRRTTACHRGGRAAADVPSAAHRWSAQHHPCADLPAVALGAAGPAARRTVHDGPVRINEREEDALRGVLRPSALARPVALVAVGVGLALAPPYLPVPVNLAHASSPAATARTHADPVTQTRLVCPGPEALGVEGLPDQAAQTVSVAAVSAPPVSLPSGFATSSGAGSLTMSGLHPVERGPRRSLAEVRSSLVRSLRLDPCWSPGSAPWHQERLPPNGPQPRRATPEAWSRQPVCRRLPPHGWSPEALRRVVWNTWSLPTPGRTR